MNKANWTYKTFEECIEKVKYTQKLLTKDFAICGKYPIISQEEELISGFCDNEDFVFKTHRPLVIFGDHTRVLKYVDFDFVLGADGVKILLPVSYLQAKFLYYFLGWYQIPNLGYSRHYKLLKEITLPIPPIEEQERIVAELDLISGVIEKQKAQLKELDNLAQSIFYDMFGDPVTNEKGWRTFELNQICDVRDGTHDSPKYVESGYPLVTSKNIVDGMVSFENVSYINQYDFDSISKRSKVDDGDIIMPMIGTIGNPIIVKKDRDFAIKNVALIKFSSDSKVTNKFIFAILSSKSFSKYLTSKNKGGTQKFIALGDIRKLMVPVPNISLQIVFAQKIYAIEKQKECIKESVKEMETLLQSRMDYYFD